MVRFFKMVAGGANKSERPSMICDARARLRSRAQESMNELKSATDDEKILNAAEKVFASYSLKKEMPGLDLLLESLFKIRMAELALGRELLTPKIMKAAFEHQKLTVEHLNSIFFLGKPNQILASLVENKAAQDWVKSKFSEMETPVAGGIRVHPGQSLVQVLAALTPVDSIEISYSSIVGIREEEICSLEGRCSTSVLQITGCNVDQSIKILADTLEATELCFRWVNCSQETIRWLKQAYPYSDVEVHGLIEPRASGRFSKVPLDAGG